MVTDEKLQVLHPTPDQCNQQQLTGGTIDGIQEEK
jgi:hypothetical protein